MVLSPISQPVELYNDDYQIMWYTNLNVEKNIKTTLGKKSLLTYWWTYLKVSHKKLHPKIINVFKVTHFSVAVIFKPKSFDINTISLFPMLQPPLRAACILSIQQITSTYHVHIPTNSLTIQSTGTEFRTKGLGGKNCNAHRPYTLENHLVYSGTNVLASGFLALFQRRESQFGSVKKRKGCFSTKISCQMGKARSVTNLHWCRAHRKHVHERNYGSTSY